MMNEDGTVYARLFLEQCHIEGIDGLELSYDKVERQTDTFDVTWKFNNIDFELNPGDGYENS